MPLDPLVRRIIEEFNRVKPQLSKVPIDEVRKMSKASSLSQPRRQIHNVFDISIPGSEVKIPARVYIPREGKDFGVLVYFHGGGFVFGDVESYD